jgi:peptidoglycan L-alanyl-D-glutamate endopeptidase CwlK
VNIPARQSSRVSLTPLVLCLVAASPAWADTTIPQTIRCLQTAYPNHICAVQPNALVWCDGTVMPFEDGRQPSDHTDRLANPDLADQMHQRYSEETSPDWRPATNDDPGRIRFEPFFRKMYGDTKKKAASTLTTVRWLPKSANRRLRVTTVNNVHTKLQAVSDAIEKLPLRIRKKMAKTAGGFHWRRIRKTSRTSMHSFGIAVDVGMGHADFWRWRGRSRDGTLRYRNRLPMEVVRIFEQQGFIWGGRWYHFDTMHFEYRPELLVPACMRRDG